jgi:peptidoglycan lytic transglycosylase G
MIGENDELRKLFITLFSVLFLSFAAIAGILMDLQIYADRPTTADEKNLIFVIRSGQGFETIAKNLKDAGLLKRPFKFNLLARLSGRDKKIKAGEYLIPPLMTPNRLLDLLVSGKVRLYRLTIPEGFRLAQIAAAVESAGLASADDFLKAATDPRRVKQEGIEAAHFEGYLFPDTYYFAKSESPEEILSAMVDRFRAVFTRQWRDRADRMGFTVHQIVTLASIIEKETGAAFERPIISSVFHNRLKKRMRLESDPTVIYGIEAFDGNLTRKHLSASTLYNTYRIRGLPPGPIASPGAEALAAALFPADTRYFYFVSKKDGTHQFSSNIKDHNRAVRKYQLRR